MAILDYEVQQYHNISVMVEGLGQTESGTLLVKVMDMNEVHIFSNLPTAIDISAESTKEQQQVTSIQF